MQRARRVARDAVEARVVVGVGEAVVRAAEHRRVGGRSDAALEQRDAARVVAGRAAPQERAAHVAHGARVAGLGEARRVGEAHLWALRRGGVLRGGR